MQTVRVLCNVDCTWEGENPTYRAYVNGELFTERTWIWRMAFLEEAFLLEAPAGEYQIKYEMLSPDATLQVSEWRIDHGNATINDNGLVTIQ